jgi:hypothetical protein
MGSGIHCAAASIELLAIRRRLEVGQMADECDRLLADLPLLKMVERAYFAATELEPSFTETSLKEAACRNP